MLPGLMLFLSLTQEGIVNVRQVLYIGDVVATKFEIADQDIGRRIRKEMAQMGRRIGGNAAHIDGDAVRGQDKAGHLALQGVVQVQHGYLLSMTYVRMQATAS